MSKVFSGFVAAFAVAALTVSSQAALLGLNPAGSTDDITAGSITVVYDGAGKLTLTGIDTGIVGNSINPFINGAFTLTAYLTPGGGVDTTKISTLDVKGGSSAANVLYHSTELKQFGFLGATGRLDFIFGVGTGQFGGLGTIGVKVGNIGAFSDAFGSTPFATTTSASADTYTCKPIPLPAGALSGATGLAVVALLKKRRKQGVA